MQLDGLAPSENRALWTRVIVAIWVVLLAAVCVRSVTGPPRASLAILWQAAGRAWIEGRTLYADLDDKNLNGFRYGPPIAGLLAPLGKMPLWAVDVVWRLLNAAVLVTGLLWWLQTTPHALTRRQEALLHGLVALLSLASLNNGQVNTMLAGLFVLGLAAVARGRWTIAAISMALLAWIKVYPLMPCILVAIVYPRRFAPRFFIALVGFAALPFVLQSPAYALEQYETWWQFLQTNDVSRRFLDFGVAYRDLLLILRVWNIPVDLRVYTLIQLGGAAGCAGWCLLGRLRGIPTEAILFRILVLGTGWMLLLGPATESSTYVLCAVPVSWWLIHVHLHGSPLAKYNADCAVGFLVLCVVAVIGPAGRNLYHAAALQPLAMLLWLGSYLLAGDPGAARQLAIPGEGDPLGEQRGQDPLAA